MQLSEADTRSKLVDPALYACGWTEDHIRREETPGSVDIIDSKPRRAPRGRLDYTLRLKVNPDTQPVAVALIEAKSEHHAPTHGLEQGKRYAAASKRLNVNFVFATNGHLFVEYDRTTGLTQPPRPLSDFPSPEALRRRYEAAQGFSLDDPTARPLLVRYPHGEATRRYYQDAAIRAVLEKIARCEHTGKPRRALLSLATGSGKTFIAVNLLKRIADAGQLRRALFVCDRDELRSQALGAFQNVFGNDAAAASSGNPQKNARVVVATYQTLDVDTDEADASFLTTNYPEDYFSHIIIDECHRSAWGRWSLVLTRNPGAVQVGLTATPRQLESTEDTPETQADQQVTADNFAHFGEPVYEYDMGQGIEDGYLAACQIIRGDVNLDETGISLEDLLQRNPVDFNTGLPVSAEELQELYEKTQYENRIMLPDRVLAMSQDLFAHLLATGGPEQKTIIFCVRDVHADLVAAALNNLYADWCAQQGRKRCEHYAFKCTAASSGQQYISDLKGAPRSHFVATTVELLTTGVDVPPVENIVFFKYVKSPIAFYQMVGRGTRIHEATGKLMFRVYDYTNATRLFGEAFLTTAPPSIEPPPSPEPAEEERDRPTIIQAHGFEVHITHAGPLIVTQVDGVATPVTIEEYKQQLAARLVEEAPTLDAFRERWCVPTDRHELMDSLPEAGRSAHLIRQLDDLSDCDLFDVLADLGYGMAPKTRAERSDAFTYKHAAWLDTLPPPASRTLTALAAQFQRAGTEGLESAQVFQVPEVVSAGGLPALSSLGEPAEVLHEAKERIFAA